MMATRHQNWVPPTADHLWECINTAIALNRIWHSDVYQQILDVENLETSNHGIGETDFSPKPASSLWLKIETELVQPVDEG